MKQIQKEKVILENLFEIKLEIDIIVDLIFID